MKLYTVAEFAREKGVSRYTVMKWAKEGRLKGLIEKGRSYLIPEDLIPEENLSISIRKKRKTKKIAPIITEDKAREAYSNHTSNNRSKQKLSYDEFKEMFESGMTIESIATRAGVTKQRISQIYNQFFSLGVDGYERRTSIVREVTRNRELRELMDSERISYLEKVVKERGLMMKPLQWNGVEINGRSCKIHLARKDTKFVGTRYRSYSRILVTRRLLNFYEFVIAIVGDGEKKIFIIPTEDIIGICRKGERRKSIYLPTSEQGQYRNISPILDWWSYLDAWFLL